MKLFPDCQGNITLPPSPLRRKMVGGNVVFQQAFRGGCTSADAETSESEGYYLVKTRLAFPFNELLLRCKGSRRIETNYLVLLAPEIKRIHELGPDTRLEWDDLGLLTRSFSNPEQILESWKGKFSFREEDNVAGTKGLRSPQIGALHAAAAHFAVGKNFEPATVVLPTGTGKTETILSMQVYKRLQRTLVIVPSDALRTQISRKFLTLGVYCPMLKSSH
jgi:hypothetical protein